jgi:citrate lyase subunit beta/citryl-CoA lyase
MLETDIMVPFRSTLFVPGNRPSWIEKAAGYGADALILDLEDSVPSAEKRAAREVTKAGVQALKAGGQHVAVRVNGFASGLTADDLAGVVCAELDSVSLPKVESADDLFRLDRLIAELERGLGLPVGRIDTPLICGVMRPRWRGLPSRTMSAFHPGPTAEGGAKGFLLSPLLQLASVVRRVGDVHDPAGFSSSFASSSSRARLRRSPSFTACRLAGTRATNITTMSGTVIHRTFHGRRSPFRRPTSQHMSVTERQMSAAFRHAIPLESVEISKSI